MKHIAFVLDPDNYWIEVLPRSKSCPPTEITGMPSFQQTMIRIKDPALTVPFYEKVFGLTLVAKRDFP
jgi:lactoylglutathione lyase